MRRFMVHFVTETDFVDGDEAADEVVQNYKKHLAETFQHAAEALSLRTIKGVQVENVLIEEIKAEGL
jgi:translation elongation factor EF-Ts